MKSVAIAAIQRRILWFSVLAVLLTGVVVAAVTIVPLGATLRAVTGERLDHISAVKALSVRQYASSLTGVALQVTSRTAIRAELEAFNRGERTIDEVRSFTTDKIADAMTLAPGVRGITRLGRDGAVLVQVGEVIDMSMVGRVAAAMSPAGGEGPAAMLLGPYASSSGPLRMVAAAPISSRDGLHQGTDVVLFSADALGPLLAPRGGDEAEVTTFLGTAVEGGGTGWFTAGPDGQLTTSVPPDPDDGWSLSATAVEPAGWTLVAATPTASLYRHVDMGMALAGLAVAALIALAVLVLLILLRPLAGHTLVTAHELQGRVDELQGLRRQLEEERLRLVESNAELEQFAYAASHDMRQPLRMVISFLDLLRRRSGAALDGESQSYVQEAVDGARRLNAMIEGLLEYSRVGRLEEALRPVDLNGVVARAEANLAQFLDEAEADVDVSALPTVQAEDAQMVRLFQNLIENAVKYRAPDRPPRIRISAEPAGDGRWTIRVSDNGQGMDPAQAPRAFLLFQRLHPGGSGTGLGLALCYKIVTRHGGTISLETEEGKGTTVVFTLPGATPAQPPGRARDRNLEAA